MTVSIPLNNLWSRFSWTLYLQYPERKSCWLSFKLFRSEIKTKLYELFLVFLAIFSGKDLRVVQRAHQQSLGKFSWTTLWENFPSVRREKACEREFMQQPLVIFIFHPNRLVVWEILTSSDVSLSQGFNFHPLIPTSVLSFTGPQCMRSISAKFLSYFSCGALSDKFSLEVFSAKKLTITFYGAISENLNQCMIQFECYIPESTQSFWWKRTIRLIKKVQIDFVSYYNDDFFLSFFLTFPSYNFDLIMYFHLQSDIQYHLPWRR